MQTLEQEGDENVGIFLSEENAFKLRLLIESNIDCRLSTYCERVGINHSNLLTTFNGRRRLTMKTLTGLLSGLDLDFQCLVSITFSTKTAQDVASTNLEEDLFLEGMDNAPEGQ